jgi:hypothetical protein
VTVAVPMVIVVVVVEVVVVTYIGPYHYTGRTTIYRYDKWSQRILVEQLIDRVNQLMFALLCVT